MEWRYIERYKYSYVHSIYVHIRVYMYIYSEDTIIFNKTALFVTIAANVWISRNSSCLCNFFIGF